MGQPRRNRYECMDAISKIAHEKLEASVLAINKQDGENYRNLLYRNAL